MTTKHVVADDLLGKLSRKQWELQRRVQEGTLSAEKVLSELQRLIEGQMLSAFGFEAWPMTLSHFKHRVDPGAFKLNDVFCYKNGFRTGGSDIPAKLERLELTKGRIDRGEIVEVQLLRIDQPCSLLAALDYIESAGYQVAHAWEFAAFVQSSIVTKGIHPIQICCLGTFLAEGKEPECLSIGGMTLQHDNPNEWSLGFHPISESLFCPRWKEVYILVRTAKDEKKS